MELNRNHYMMAGLLALLIGLQVRSVESYVLNASTTRFLAEKLGSAPNVSTSPGTSIFAANGPAARKVLQPPKWLGWALMSVGSVLVLHSLAMKKPGT